LEESFRSPGNTDLKKKAKTCPNTCSLGCPRGPSQTKGTPQRSHCEIRLAVALETWLWWTDFWLLVLSPPAARLCLPARTAELLRVHLLNQGLLVAQGFMAKPDGWHLLQLRLRHLCTCSAISPYAPEPSDINHVPLRTHRLEICSESDCFPGICPWSRGCTEQRLRSAV